MICRCRDKICPGCPVEIDCTRCGELTDTNHADDRGRCVGCVEALADESLADAAVQPEVIRAAVDRALSDVIADILDGAESLEREAREMSEATHPGGRSYRVQTATTYRYIAARIQQRGVSP